MNVLGIIPARGGSKGVKRKNLIDIDGNPLIRYSFQTAQESTLMTQFVVSTDDDEIEEYAISQKVDVVKRPKEIAEDHSPVIDAVKYTLDQLETQFDLIILLQPTSPIRTGEDLDNVIKMFEDQNLDGVVSVIPMDDVHPARMYELEDDKTMVPLNEQMEVQRRQELPVVYYRNGAIYAIRTKTMYDERTLMAKRKKGYVMSADLWANIDCYRDVIVTDALVRAWKKGEIA